MKKLIWIAAAALAAGCAMNGQEAKKSEAMTAQEQAHQSLQQAADAQKRAADEQAKAEQAQRDVEQAQRQLAEARARLRGQRVRAEQAQADAQRMSEQAAQEAQTQQSQAAQFQQQQNQQSAQLNDSRSQEWTQEQDVQGRVVQASGGQLQLRTDDQKLLRLDLTDSTAVSLDGRSGSASQIQPGSDVRASYQLIDGKARALKIDVTSNGGNLPSQDAQPAQDNSQRNDSIPPPPPPQDPAPH
jgi:colicin import membrane protein